jgi:hypothetical protein
MENNGTCPFLHEMPGDTTIRKRNPTAYAGLELLKNGVKKDEKEVKKGFRFGF